MQKDFLQKLKELDNYTYTENGAVALKSTGNAILDAFGSLGAMKDSPETQILDTWYRAFYEDKALAMKLLFYIRDIRGGQGMRRVFRTIVRNMAGAHPEYVTNNLDNFLYFGRGDDVLCLLDTPIEGEVYKWVTKVLLEDIDAVDKGTYPSMLAKWLPSENASSAETRYYARKMISGLDVSPKNYRKTLAKLRARIGVVESLMSSNRWDEIDFEKLPSRAAMIYSDAFCRHAKDNYIKYLEKLADGNAKVNAGALFPYDIAHKVFNGGASKPKDHFLLDAMWKALPNYFGDTEETGLCVVDTSGSMYGTPMEVAYSLGLYCADKAKGPFHNHFITFSYRPTLQEIKGDSIVDKIRSMNLGICSNTNIEAVFNLILGTAKTYHLNQEDLPSKLYIISDMQWDACVMDNSGHSHLKPETFIETMKKRYEEAGYEMPAIVYWNVRSSHCGMFQQGSGENNCCMVSGYSPSLFKSIMDGTTYVDKVVVDKDGNTKVVSEQQIDPLTVMLTALNNERYDIVWSK